MSNTEGSYPVMDISSHAINIDLEGIPKSVSIDLEKPVLKSIQHEETDNSDQINMFLDDTLFTTALQNHLKSKLTTDTKSVVSRIVHNRETPTGIQYIVASMRIRPKTNHLNDLTTYPVIS